MSVKRLGIELTADTTGLHSGLVAASRQVRTFASEVGVASQSIFSRSTIMQAGMAAAAVGTVVAIRSTIGAAIGFEVQMRNVNSIMHQSEQQFAKTSALVLGLSRTLPQSAEEFAKGLYDVASSGFQGSAGLTVLVASAKAAVAGMTDTATAAKGITAVLNAYGLQAQDAADVSDILFQTVNLGVISFEELSSQIGDFVGIAAAAHIPIQDATSAIAAMTLSGISAAESSTSLNRVIQSLLQPSDTLKTVLHGMGFESGYAAVQALGLHGVMERLRKETGGNVEVLLALFPEIRAARGAFALMADGGRTYLRTQREISSEVRRAHATEKAFNEQMKAVGNQLHLVSKNASEWGQELGMRALPAVSGLTSGLGHLINVLRGSTDFLIKHKEVLEAVAILYAARLGGRVLESVALGLYDVAGAAHRAGGTIGLLKVGLAGLVDVAPVVIATGLLEWFNTMNSQTNKLASNLRNIPHDEWDKQTSAIHAAEAEYARLGKELDKLQKGTLTGGMIGGVIEALPGTANKTAEIRGQMKDIADAINTWSRSTANEARNSIAIAKQLGRAWGPELNKQILKTAQTLNVDLTQSLESSGPARAAVVDSFKALSELTGLTLDQISAIGPAVIESMQKAEDAAKQVGSGLAEAFGLFGAGFELGDPAKQVKDVRDATDKLAEAERRHADAQQKVTDNLRYLSRTPDRDRDLAEARRNVAAAERDVADARIASNIALERQLHPEKAVADEYRKQVAAFRAFLTDVQKAGARGLDTGFLARALQNPDQFRGVVHAIAGGHNDGLLRQINASENQLHELRRRGESMFMQLQQAADAGMAGVTSIVAEGLRRAMTDPLEEVYKLGFQVGATYASGIAAGLGDITGLVASAGGSPDLVLANAEPGRVIGNKAHGAVDAHIATSETILFGERSTGGEAYIPLGAAHRGRSSALLGDVAQRFGYGLVPMARGGLVGVGSSGGPTTNHYSKTNRYEFGDISGPSMQDIERYADRKARLSALMGAQ